MTALYDGDHIQDDLDLLRNSPATAADADRLDAFLSELAGDETALRQMTEWSIERTYPDPIFNVKAIVELQQEGFNIYRIRGLRALGSYRILYAYHPKPSEDCLYALAVVKKKPQGMAYSHEYYDYERNHPITLRVLEEYDGIGIPRIR